MNKLNMLVCHDSHDGDLYGNLLANFNVAHQRMLDISYIPWERAKQELLAVALYGKNVDLSEVGASNVTDLVAMNALRPFSKEEMDSFGGRGAFPAIAWNLNASSETDQVFAIPFVLDGRALIFWRDMLADAGINEATAFTSFDHLEQTLEKLQKAGIHTPWVIGAADKFITFQTACTWIWGQGCDISKNGEVTFDHPETLDALKRYFAMVRFMPSNQSNPSLGQARQMFAERKAAVILDSVTGALSGMLPENRNRIGVISPPGPTYVGSTKLVIWRNSRQANAALNLIRYLTSHECQVNFPALVGFMPARISALMDSQLADNPNIKIASESILHGRTYANLPLSHLVEDILASALSRVWQQLIAEPYIDIKSLLAAEITPATRRIRRLWERVEI